MARAVGVLAHSPNSQDAREGDKSPFGSLRCFSAPAPAGGGAREPQIEEMFVSEASSGPTPGTVMIGDKPVGPGHPTYVIGEIGINHNGDIDIARQLIDIAADAGCDAVKFQKRTPELSTPAAQRDVMRDTPWGRMTYLEYKYRVEFEQEGYREIDVHCAKRGLHWFASPWDVPSVAFLEQFDVVTHKIASASVTDLELLTAVKETGKPVILSTGMSTLEEIDKAVET